MQIIELFVEQRATKILFLKMQTVIEEADETLFWLEIIVELKIIDDNNELSRLLKEADELVAIFVSSVKTVKKRINK